MSPLRPWALWYLAQGKKGEAGMGNSLKVMLVDDEVTILEGFKRLFDWKAYGCEVVCEALDLSLIHN